MAIRVQNFPKKIFGQSSIHSMPHFSINYPAGWNSHEQRFPPSFSKNLSLKMESLKQVVPEAKHLDLQPQDQDSSSSQSTGQSHQEVTATGGTNSQDQCISSDSVQDESYRKRVECQMKLDLFMGNPNFSVNPLQVDINQSMTHISYPYADPNLSGLFTAYGPHAIIQPQMVGIAPARVPLPLDLSEDGPIYVNAKQYNGILRRRQKRAKLEAQNKLVKNRRPYLHESRHLHALNRVRGSGGRFVSKKKSQQRPDPTPPSSSRCASDFIHFSQKEDISEFEVHQSETGKCDASTASCSGVTHVINGDVIFQQPDPRFSSIPPHISVAMQGRGQLMSNGSRHRAPVVR